MNRITRMLTVTGVGVVAAVTVGAGQAMASTSGSQTPAKPAASAAAAKPGIGARTRVIDVYRSYGSCESAGEWGRQTGDWDDYYCYRTIGGYALQVQFDDWNDWNRWDNDGWRGDWRGPWGIHGVRFHGGIGGVFRGHHGNFGDRGGFRGNRDFRGPNGSTIGHGHQSAPGIGGILN